MDKSTVRKELEESAGLVCFNDLKVDILNPHYSSDFVTRVVSV